MAIAGGIGLTGEAQASAKEPAQMNNSELLDILLDRGQPAAEMVTGLLTGGVALPGIYSEEDTKAFRDYYRLYSLRPSKMIHAAAEELSRRGQGRELLRPLVGLFDRILLARIRQLPRFFPRTKEHKWLEQNPRREEQLQDFLNQHVERARSLALAIIGSGVLPHVIGIQWDEVSRSIVRSCRNGEEAACKSRVEIGNFISLIEACRIGSQCLSREPGGDLCAPSAFPNQIQSGNIPPISDDESVSAQVAFDFLSLMRTPGLPKSVNALRMMLVREENRKEAGIRRQKKTGRGRSHEDEWLMGDIRKLVNTKLNERKKNI